MVLPSCSHSFSAAASPSEPIRATLFPGDGIGPEIAESVKQVFYEEPLLSSTLFTKHYNLPILLLHLVETREDSLVFDGSACRFIHSFAGI